MMMNPSDMDRRVICPVRKGTETGVPLTCEGMEHTWSLVKYLVSASYVCSFYTCTAGVTVEKQ